MRRISRFDQYFLTTLIAILAIALSGCAQKQNLGDANSFSLTAEMQAIADISTEERAIATRICYAYQSKYSNFLTPTYLGGTFNFGVTSSTCQNGTSAYSVSGRLASPKASSLVYQTSSTQEFLKTVQTSKEGFLSQLCGKIFNNQPISNTTSVSEYQVQISFFRSDVDSYILKYFSSSSGTAKITMAETFKVRTQFDITNASQILGMDESYSKQKVCNDLTSYSNFTQDFTGYSPAQ